MQIRKFQLDKDLQNLETYLRNQYFRNKNMSSWLPERLHDLIYRMGTQEVARIIQNLWYPQLNYPIKEKIYEDLLH